MFMKVVYNGCYGGFSLSHEAVMRYAEIKGIKLYAFTWIGKGRITESTIVPVTEEMLANSSPDDIGLIHYGTEPVYSNDAYWSDDNIERDDPALVQVVEELGDKANGRCAKLRIENVSKGSLWRIDEYDGNESVMTQDSYSWNVAD
jgi:hypothetical protein